MRSVVALTATAAPALAHDAALPHAHAAAPVPLWAGAAALVLVIAVAAGYLRARR
jgi:hypothetical protein